MRKWDFFRNRTHSRLEFNIHIYIKRDSITIGIRFFFCIFLSLRLLDQLWVNATWIWAKLSCFSSFATVSQWLSHCPLAPLWISTTSGKRGWRRCADRFWVNSGWPVRLRQRGRPRYPFRFWPFITAPRSSSRSWEETGSRVADRIAQRLSTTPKRFTSSTWSMFHLKTVSFLSILSLYIMIEWLYLSCKLWMCQQVVKNLDIFR